MDTNSDEQLLIIQSKVESNNQETDEKLTKLTEDIAMITSTLTSMMDHTNNSKSSPSQKDTSDTTYPTTVVPANRRDP